MHHTLSLKETVADKESVKPKGQSWMESLLLSF